MMLISAGADVNRMTDYVRFVTFCISFYNVQFGLLYVELNDVYHTKCHV
jgi:hypothetical protein